MEQIEKTAELVAKLEYLVNELDEKQAKLEATKALPDKGAKAPEPPEPENWVVRNVINKRNQIKAGL